MAISDKIQFQETSANPTDFLHELNDPNLLRNGAIPPRARAELRRQQVLKLRENIAVLTAKREEFNRKMEEYVRNLEALIRTLERSNAGETETTRARHGDPHGGTQVRCLRCETERVFGGLQIIFARESDESMCLPTEVYALVGGVLKKGHFLCDTCGAENLVIRGC